jgi:two-component system chemotaxis response regulator CheY
MSKIYIICIDDQPEVLNALENDLRDFESLLNIEVCESGEEALELIDEIDSSGDYVALVISDHVMPNKTGVETLKELQNLAGLEHTQRVLLTGLATHSDTIEAINSAGLNYYIQKPWTKEELSTVVMKSLTTFLLKSGLEYQDYMPMLHQETLYEALRKNS